MVGAVTIRIDIAHRFTRSRDHSFFPNCLYISLQECGGDIQILSLLTNAQIFGVLCLEQISGFKRLQPFVLSSDSPSSRGLLGLLHQFFISIMKMELLQRPWKPFRLAYQVMC